jgi:hypothetical protein
MGICLDDKLKFGKYKGETVGQVIIDDSGYLVWLRDQKGSGVTKEGTTTPGPSYFDKEVNIALDMCIENSKPLKKKYKKWSELHPGLMGDTPLSNEAEPLIEAIEIDRGAEWGSF